MKTFTQTLACSLIFIQMYAQQIPYQANLPEKENTNWISFKTAEQIPAQQLAQNKSTLKLEADDDLQLLKTEEDPLGFRHYRYQQTYKGIPVEGAVYLMHEKNNQVKHANGKLVQKLNLSTFPTVPEMTALQSALQYTNAKEYAWQDLVHESMLKEVENRADATFYPTGELVITNPNVEQKAEDYRLAYKFDVYAIEPLSRQIVYVDAQAGTVLGAIEKIHDCTGETTITANTDYSGTVSFTACSDGTLENSTGGGVKVFTAGNSQSYPQILAENTDPTAAEVFWATDKTYDYFLNTHNRNSLDGNGMALLSWVHYRESYNNAFWNGSWMTYGDGDNIRFSSLTAPDVVAHEMTHGLTDFSADLVYRAESGALNESFSDIFGEVAENYMRGSNDWLMGADFTVQSGKTTLRSMSNPNDPTAITRQPDTYLGDFWYAINPPCSFFNDQCGVHYNSGVQNFWFYLLSQGGSGTNDNGDAYTVSGIGMSKAAAITYRNLTVYLTSTSEYADAQAGAIQAATDLYGAGSNEVIQTEAAWCAVGVGTCGVNPVTCRYSDSLALVTLYNSTNGANWTNTWNLNQSMDNWYGVTLNAGGCVTCIDMDGDPDCTGDPAANGNNLSGSIPAAIGDLSNLTHLLLSKNQLSGSIPAELGNLANLQVLILHNNLLSGNISTGLGNLTNLTTLALNDNQLTGAIPVQLGSLTSLTTLALAGNQLIGNIPPELGSLTNLTGLWLHSNQLSGSIPAVFSNLTNLTILWVSFNQLSGCYATNLTGLCNAGSNATISNGNNFDASWADFCSNGAGGCPVGIDCSYTDSLALVDLYYSTNGSNWTNAWNLNQPMNTWNGVVLNTNGCVSRLQLYDRGLNGTLPAALGDLTELTYIWMGNDQISGSIPTGIGSLTQLTDFNIQNAQLSGTIPAGIGNLTNLTNLSLGNNNLSGNIPTGVGNLTNLIYLYLNGNQLSGNIPSGIGNLTNVVYLNLSSNQLSGSIPSQVGNMSSVISMNLAYNELSGNIPPQIGNLNLGTLSLQSNQLSGNIPPELGNLSNVSYLGLRNNNLTGSIPGELGNLSNLTSLFLNSNDLSGCYDANLTILCTQLSPSWNSNAWISNGNNLDATWEDFCNTGAGTCLVSTSCRYLDSLALVALYNSTNGANWTTTWNLNQPMDNWYGVTLNGDGCVTHLLLGDNQLTGTISTEIGGLSNLTELSFYNNNLSGGIPAELGNLTNLVELILSVNQLSGSIPPELGSLNELTNLYLHQNQLSGNIPSELGDLNSLIYLGLHYNQLSSSIPSTFGNLNNVTYLSVHSNNLSGSIPSELGNASSLSILDLHANQLSGNIPSEFGNASNLTRLFLSSNQLSGSIPSELGNLNNLDYLWLHSNNLSGCYAYNLGNLCSQLISNSNTNSKISDGNNLDAPWEDFCNNSAGECTSTVGCRYTDSLALVALYNSTNGANWTTTWNLNQPMDSWYGVTLNSDGCVRQLNLNSNQVTGSIPPEAGNLSSLIEFSFYNNNLSGSIPAQLGNLSNLTSLSLGSNNLNGTIPPQLGNLSNLQYLFLQDNQLSGVIPPELGDLSSLGYLNLFENQLSGTIPSELGNLNNIVQLVLYDNQLTGNIPPEFGNLSNLVNLGLHNNELSGTIPPELGNLNNLTSLNLSHNELIGNIPSELGNLSNLGFLILDDNQLSGIIPSELANISSLASLHIQNNQLSGCYDPNLQTLCSQTNGNNTLISNGNNFDATWSDFCNSGAGICTDDEVWPGDFNNDGVVEISDLLYWSVAENNTGVIRPNASLNWAAQSCPDWQNSINGINGKHQDGDGNGIVDNNDLNALVQNYDSTHTIVPINYGVSPITFKLELVSSIPTGNVTTNTFNLYVESSLGMPVSLHGLACSIDFSELSGINSVSVDVTGSSLSPQVNLDFYHPTQKKLDLSLSRTDKVNRILSGEVIRLIVIEDNMQGGYVAEISVENSKMLSIGGGALEDEVIITGANGSSLYGTYAGTGGLGTELAIAVNKTDEQCNVLGQAEVQPLSGTAPYTYNWSTGATDAQVSDLASGLYSVTVTDANGLNTIVPIQINGAIPIFDAFGNPLCNNDCPDFLTPTGGLPDGTYSADNTIDSDATILPSNTIEFKAGQIIKLDNDFIIPPGATFSGEIEDCSGN